jgi:transposase
MEPVRCANCQALQRRVHDLQAENERLRRQLDEATRAGKRQAGPFAKGEPKPNPRSPVGNRAMITAPRPTANRLPPSRSTRSTLWAHRDDLLTFLRQPGLDATKWRAELAIRVGVILRKVWGGSRTWGGARAQSVLMSVWRTCWQQGRSALDFLSQLLRGASVVSAMPP